jgi:hypothetical protein
MEPNSMLDRLFNIAIVTLITTTPALAADYPSEEPETPKISADPSLDSENCWVAPEWRAD